MSIIAGQAQPGDRTCYGTTVIRREPCTILGLYVVLHTRTCDGLALREVWPVLGDLAMPYRDDVSLRGDALRPGMTIHNPLGTEPWVLDVLAVTAPDATGLVTISAVQDTVQVAPDWPARPYTLADADLEATLLMDCHNDLFGD